MKHYLILFSVFSQINLFAQIDHLINKDSLVFFNYSKVDKYKVEGKDTTLHSRYLFDKQGNLDTLIEYDFIFAFDENSKMYKTESDYTIKYVYKYLDNLLIEKSRILLDTIVTISNLYEYNNKNQLIKETFGNESSASIFIYKYKSGNNVLEIDLKRNIKYHKVYDKQKRLVKAFDSKNPQEQSRYFYLDKNDSYIRYQYLAEEMEKESTIVQNNNLKLPVLLTSASYNGSSQIDKFFYTNGLLTVYELFYLVDSKTVSKEYFFLTYE